MPNVDKLESLANIPKLESEFEIIKNNLSEIKMYINSIGKLEGFAKSATGLRDLTIATEKLAKVQRDSAAMNAKLVAVQVESEKVAQRTTKAHKEQVVELTKLDQAKQRLAESNSKEAKELAIVNQKIAENNKLNSINAKIENSIVGSLEYHRAVLAKLIHQREIENGLTVKSQANLKRLNTEIDKHNNYIQKNVSALEKQKINIGNYPKVLDAAASGFKKLGQQVLYFVGITSLISFIHSSIDGVVELDGKTRLLKNTLKNVGASEAFGRISDKVVELKKEFGYLGKSELYTSFQKLITYGKLTEKQINDLVPVIINFSAQTGQSIEESTSLILRSLQGSNKGLREFGINLKDAKTPAEALKIVMEQLAPKVLGAGKAFADSAEGGFVKAKKEFANIKNEIGTGLLPALNSLLTFVVKSAKGLVQFAHTIRDLFSIKATSGPDVTLDVAKELSDKALAKINTLPEKDQGAARQKELDFIESQIAATNKAAKAVDIFNQGLDKTAEGFRHNIKGGLFSDSKKEILENIKQLEAVEDIQRDQKYYGERKRLILDEIALKQNNVLGTGDIDAPFHVGPTPKDKKGKGSDTKGELFKQLQEERKAKFEALKQELQDKIDADSDLLSQENKTFEEKLIIAKNFYEDSLALTEAQKTFDLGEVDKQSEEDKRKARLDIENKKDLNDTLEAIDKASAANKVKIQSKYNTDVKKLDRENTSQFLQIKTKHDAEVEQHNKTAHEIELSQIQNGYDEASNELEKSHNKGLISDKEYNKKKLLLELNLQKDLLQSQIEFAQKEIDLAKIKANLPGGTQEDKDAVATAEERLNGLRIKLATIITDFFKKKNKETKDDFIDTFNKIAAAAQQLGDIIGGFVSASIDKQKNAVQELINTLDKQKEKDIEVANQSIANVQDRAAAISIIEARAAAKKEQLELRQRQLDEKRAKFEKALAITNIILKTAQAVITAYTEGDPYTKIPRSIAAAIIGAAELAVAIATPIPHYKYGTQDKAHSGGPAVVGDGGRAEGLILPDGTVLKSPSTATLMNLPKGTHVDPDFNKMVLRATLTGVPEIKIKSSEQYSEKAFKKVGQDIVAAIKNKTETHFHSPEKWKMYLKDGHQFRTYLNNKL